MYNPLVNESPPLSAANPFSAKRLRPGVIPFLFPPDMDWSELDRRLGEHRYRGQVVGPHGTGKSTLFADWKARLARQGWNVVTIRMHHALDWQQRRRDLLRLCSSLLSVSRFQSRFHRLGASHGSETSQEPGLHDARGSWPCRSTDFVSNAIERGTGLPSRRSHCTHRECRSSPRRSRRSAVERTRWEHPRNFILALRLVRFGCPGDSSTGKVSVIRTLVFGANGSFGKVSHGSAIGRKFPSRQILLLGCYVT